MQEARAIIFNDGCTLETLGSLKYIYWCSCPSLTPVNQGIKRWGLHISFLRISPGIPNVYPDLGNIAESCYLKWGQRGVTSEFWQHKMSLIFVSSLTNKIWHPSINKSAFVGVVVSWTICQGIQEESCLALHLIIGRQNLIWAEELAGACELVSVPLSHDLGAPGKHRRG